MIRYCISNPKKAASITVDDIDTLILGYFHDDHWVVFEEENNHLFNTFLLPEHAERYIEEHELEDCLVIELVL